MDCECRDAVRSPSTATTDPVGPTASARKAANSPTPGVQVEHRLPRLRPEHPEDAPDQRPGRFDVRLPEAVGRHLELAAAGGGLDVLDERALPQAHGRPGARSDTGRSEPGRASDERTSRSTATTAYRIRVRQPSPSSPGDSITITWRSIPPIRRSVSDTTVAFSRRCSTMFACWKSQPPHVPVRRTGRAVDPVR